jgi:uncharacterized membrane protein YqhA
MWSRLQTLTLVNFAGFGAWWSTLEREFFPYAVMLSLCAFNLFLFYIMMRDKDYMEWIEKNTSFPEVPARYDIFKSRWLILSLILPLTLAEAFLAIFYTPSFPPWLKKLDEDPKYQKLLEEKEEVELRIQELKQELEVE